MASTLGLRPDHYRTLGLSPDATIEQIEQAFLHKVSSLTPHAFGTVAEASVAYQVLKDPVKRRAYDVAQGFIEPPPPPEKPDFWSGRPYSMRAGRVVGARPLIAAAARPAAAAPSPEPAREAPFIAAPRAQPAPEPRVEPIQAAPVTPPTVDRPAPRFEAPAAAPVSQPASAHSEPETVMLRIAEPDEPEFDGKRTALTAGAIVVAVALFGGWLGWAAGGTDEEAPRAASEVVRKLPSATAQRNDVIPVNEAVTEYSAQPARSRSWARRAKPVQAPVAAEVLASEPAASAAPVPIESAEVPVSAEPTPPPPEPAGGAMPLSNRTIAQTIERIGYTCGSVSSAAPKGGGVFTVNCTSGESYRAAPRGGRYRFKRL